MDDCELNKNVTCRLLLPPVPSCTSSLRGWFGGALLRPAAVVRSFLFFRCTFGRPVEERLASGLRVELNRQQ